jgi:hypothetical protein
MMRGLGVERKQQWSNESFVQSFHLYRGLNASSPEVLITAMSF